MKNEMDDEQVRRGMEFLRREFGPLFAEDEEPEDGPPECCRHKHREPTEYEALLNRLNRIEGQVRGVRGMVEKEAYCTDILTQVSAIQSALNAFSRELLASHIRTCVVDGVRAGDGAVVDELVRTVEKLMR